MPRFPQCVLVAWVAASGLAGCGSSGSDANGATPDVGVDQGAPDGGDAAVCGAVDFTSDAKNCGRCGHDCLGGACTAGACAPVRLWTPATGDRGGDRIVLDGDDVDWTGSRAGAPGDNATVTLFRVKKSGGTTQSAGLFGPWSTNIVPMETTIVVYADECCSGSNVAVVDKATFVPKLVGGSSTGVLEHVAWASPLLFWADTMGPNLGFSNADDTVVHNLWRPTDNVGGVAAHGGNFFFESINPTTMHARLAIIDAASVSPTATSTPPPIAYLGDIALASTDGYPDLLAVDDQYAFVAWSHGASGATLQRIALTDGAATEIASETASSKITTFALDDASVTWSAASGTPGATSDWAVRRVPREGGATETIASGTASDWGIAVAVDATSIAWTNADGTWLLAK